MSEPELSKFVWFGVLALQIALAFRFWRLGFHFRYRAFFFWVCFQAGTNSALELLPHDSVAFYRLWLYSEPVLVLAQVLAVFELYAMALERYRGIRTISTRLLTFALVVGSLISILSIIPDIQLGQASPSEDFVMISLIRRGIYTALFTFLVLLVSLITIFPIRLSRNSIVHIVLFTTVFLSSTFMILLGNLFGLDTLNRINIINGFVSVACFLAWLVLLTPAGETVERAVRSRLSEAEVEDLLGKLRSVNDAIAASRRRV